MFYESLMEEEISSMFQGCFMIKGVSRVFQGSFKKTFKVFQKSFMCMALIAASRAEGGLVSYEGFPKLIVQRCRDLLYDILPISIM